MYSFIITKVHKEQGSVEVAYFPSDAVDKFGNPVWWYGPHNVDLPLDANRQPISGQELLDYLSNMCPDSMLERELDKRKQRQLEMSHHEELVGKPIAVAKTSPQVNSEPAPQVISPSPVLGG